MFDNGKMESINLFSVLTTVFIIIIYYLYIYLYRHRYECMLHTYNISNEQGKKHDNLDIKIMSSIMYLLLVNTHRIASSILDEYFYNVQFNGIVYRYHIFICAKISRGISAGVSISIYIYTYLKIRDTTYIHINQGAPKKDPYI